MSTKIQQKNPQSKFNRKKSFSRSSNVDGLDKMKQLGTRKGKPLVNEELTADKVFKKKAVKKVLGDKIKRELVKLYYSPLHKQYEDSLSCSSTLIHIGKKITTRHCGKRWCPICNGIRTSKLLTKYEPVFKKLVDPYLITLTAPTVYGRQLNDEVDRRIKTFAKVMQLANKHYHRNKLKTRPLAIRKLEITYSKLKFHPHIHIIADTKELADFIVYQWLRLMPDAKPDAQDMRSADISSLKEIFKYTTKFMVGKKGSQEVYSPKILDIIFVSMSKRRTFQPYGISTLKGDEEEVDELEGFEYSDVDFKEIETYIIWDKTTWYYPETGEMLVNTVIPDWVNNIKFGKPPPKRYLE